MSTQDRSIAAWARLVRLPNALTVWADSTAAFALVVGGSGLAAPQWWGGNARLLYAWMMVLFSITAMYWGGMILNDVFDVRRDRRRRSERPLPQRQISLAVARRAGWSLIGVAVLAAVWLGIYCLAISIMLAGCVIAYDGPFKMSRIAPVLMGGCRCWSFVFAASAAWAALQSDQALAPETGILAVTICMAVGMGVLVFGITMFARREVEGDFTYRLPLGWAAMAVGLLMIAFSPRWTDQVVWRLDSSVVFPLAIGLMAAPTLWRGVVAMREPSPQSIQQTIVTALSTIIPLSAAMTMLSVGAWTAMGVFALTPLSKWLRRHFQVT